MKRTLLITLACAVLLGSVTGTALLLWRGDTSIAVSGNADEVLTSVPNEEEASPVPEKITSFFPIKYTFPELTFRYETFHDPLNGNVLPYRLSLPIGYDPAKKYPVLLLLHGLGAVGTDNEEPLSNFNVLFNRNGDLVAEAVVVCPQSFGWWDLDRDQPGDQKGPLGSVLHLLDEIEKTYSCDANRIYVTGISMGGYGTWNLLQDYGDRFAAGMPVCGGGDTAKAKALTDIPIKIYHSVDDGTVSYSNSQMMFDVIQAVGGDKVEMIRLKGLGHGAWSYAYADRDGLSWLFSQHKTQNPDGHYTFRPFFTVRDQQGNLLLSERDIISHYATSYSENEERVQTTEWLLTETSQERLNQAIKATPGCSFTAYWISDKVFSFTIENPLRRGHLSLVCDFQEELQELRNHLDDQTGLQRYLDYKNNRFKLIEPS